jgi:hypothetical protein
VREKDSEGVGERMSSSYMASTEDSELFKLEESWRDVNIVRIIIQGK